MKPEAQRIAIAEACGWTWPDDLPKEVPGFYWRHKESGRNYCACPDYLTDLNAMHGAEMTLLGGMVGEWEQHLGRVTMRENKTNHAYLSDMARATSSQRAEAFLRCVGRWVD